MIPHGQVLWRPAKPLGPRVLTSRRYLEALANLRSHEASRGHQRGVSDCLGISKRQRAAAARAAADVRLRLGAGVDEHKVAANAADPVRDALLHPLADGHQRDHRRHADDDAQDRERGAQLVIGQRGESHRQGFPGLHSWTSYGAAVKRSCAFSLFSTGSIRSMRPTRSRTMRLLWWAISTSQGG